MLRGISPWILLNDTALHTRNQTSGRSREGFLLSLAAGRAVAGSLSLCKGGPFVSPVPSHRIPYRGTLEDLQELAGGFTGTCKRTSGNYKRFYRSFQEDLQELQGRQRFNACHAPSGVLQGDVEVGQAGQGTELAPGNTASEGVAPRRRPRCVHFTQRPTIQVAAQAEGQRGSRNGQEGMARFECALAPTPVPCLGSPFPLLNANWHTCALLVLSPSLPASLASHKQTTRFWI